MVNSICPGQRSPGMSAFSRCFLAGANFGGLPKINKISERPMIVFEVTTCDHRMHTCNLKLF